MCTYTFLIHFGVAVFFLCTNCYAQDQSVNGDMSRIEREILATVNDARIRHNLKPLVPDIKLQAMARSHSNDMAVRGYFSHTSPDGETPLDRARQHGIPDKQTSDGTIQIGVAENIGTLKPGPVRGSQDAIGSAPEAIASAQVSMWMDSSPHRSNILNDQYDQTGIGVARGSNGYYYITQVFR